MPGLVPQVIIGSSASPLMVTSRSNFAPSSVGSCASGRRRRPSPRLSGRTGGRGDIGKWYRPGAIMPARAPPSIDMLQTVMRPSISSARMADPVYSSTVPVPPPMPIWAISARMMSFAETPVLSEPLRCTRNVFDGRCSRHCVASTFSTSLVPMPKASAPKAPCVAVWLSPQTTVMPGCVRPSSGPMTCTMP